MDIASPQSVGRRPARKRPWLKIALVLLALLAIGVAILWWWSNRPIAAVTLSAEEKAELETKLEAVSPAAGEPGTYQRGASEIEITERELNGLLNEHTQLGESLRFELVEGAVHARVSTELEPDLPFLGGKTLKARARFFVESGATGPQLTLDDVTVWGISLPNDWLGGLKGQNLLDELLGAGGGGGVAGIERLEVKRGRLVLKLKQ